jgi:choline dehydrogenase-like flavoprotein
VRLIRPEQKRGGLTVRFGAHVQRLEWDAQKRRVAAVVFRDRASGREERVACRAVVLSAGAFNTPQVLLQSKSADFPDGLGNTHGVLGRYLNDHPIAKIVLSLGSPIGIYPAAYVTRAALDRSQPLYAAAGMQWSGAAIVARGALKGHLGQSVSTGFSVFGTMAPDRENFIALDPSKPDANGAPALTLHIRHPPEAARVLEEARDQIVSLFARAGFEPRVDVWRIEPIGNSNHYAGTCRMHASPEFGMVNAWGRLHVAQNLVVADSSVFTTNPEKNPVLTSMTLAARASDRLASELKSGDL